MRKKTKVEIFIHAWIVIKGKSPNANHNLTHTKYHSYGEDEQQGCVAVGLLVAFYWCLV
jgi:hypothetical protein